MPRPQTTFDIPHCSLVADSQARVYGNVNNAVEVLSASKRIKLVTIAVPTALFTILKETLKVDPSEEVRLFLDTEGEYFVFGLVWGDNGVADLWSYTNATLPRCFK